MVPELRKSFNSRYSDERYGKLLRRMNALGGTNIPFRISETPVFLPGPLVSLMERWGAEIILQLASNKPHLDAARQLIPSGFNAPNESPHPLFAAVDFGITLDAEGNPVPRLIELQGFPTMFVYQMLLCQQYKEVYDLPRALTPLLGGLSTDGYIEMLRGMILGSCDPENVVLTELDPHLQKTRVDFILTEHLCGIRTVNIRDIIRDGKELFYRENGRRVKIRRIYNRAIADEVLKSGAVLPFSFADDVDVEWAGHPNWYFLMSKFSIPFLKHPAVPRTHFLSELREFPDDLERWVLKPLFSFAGAGVIPGPGKGDLEHIPDDRRSFYILQERVDFGPVVETPHGGTKVEVRVMYFWPDDRPVAVNNLVRMGRGKMMGVDHNKGMLWVGSSAGLFLP
jgi:hypothetical protein